jgi:TetR/AcrR family transcriptional repressor of nem operon
VTTPSEVGGVIRLAHSLGSMGRTLTFDAVEAVDAAMDVFWLNGYAATTPRELTEAIGIGKGSLYNTFGSKHELFALALHRYADTRLSLLAASLAQPGPVKPLLRSAVEMLTGAGEHGRGCLVVNAAAELTQADELVAAVAADLFGDIQSSFGSAIERGQADGEITSLGDPNALAAELLATVIGVSVLAKAGTSPDALAHLIDTTIGRL